MKFISDGVWQADPGIVAFTTKDMAFLEAQAPLTAKRRARILAHPSQAERLHEMLIAFCADSHNPMHAHEKVESILVLKGSMTVEFPAEQRLVILNALDFLRIPAGVQHQPLPLTPCVVMETAEK